MSLLLAFAPFIAFAVIDRLVGATPGLIAGALVAAALVLRDMLSQSRSIKILEVGTLILFGGLTCYSLVMAVAWTIVGVRLCVDAGLTVEQAAWVLNCQPHDVPVLIASRLLKPLGNPSPYSVKFFATAEVLESAKIAPG